MPPVSRVVRPDAPRLPGSSGPRLREATTTVSPRFTTRVANCNSELLQLNRLPAQVGPATGRAAKPALVLGRQEAGRSYRKLVCWRRGRPHSRKIAFHTTRNASG